MSLLEVNNVSKRFGGLQALSRVSLAVNEGEIVALIGPNGAGKTTLFNALMGSCRPDSGNIRFMGTEIEGRLPHRICQMGMSRTFQIVKPFLALSVLDNVLIGALTRHADLRGARRKARDLLAFVGLEHRSLAEAGGLTLADRKRLELARVLATEPRLLLLDEVMGGLRPAEIDHLIELLRSVHKRGVTIFLIEHVMRGVMALAGRIVVLNYGENIAEGTPQDVIRNRQVIDAYLGEEFMKCSG